MASKKSSRDAAPHPVLTLFRTAILPAAGAIWLAYVCQNVEEPYLDEVFHVRQALAYITRQWHVWDPKITTPPGLYLLATLWDTAWPLSDKLTSLRVLNFAACAIFVPWKLQRLRRAYRNNDRQQRKLPVVDEEDNDSAWWVATNAALFPPLFFFSALFYTDPWSTFWVLQTLELAASPAERFARDAGIVLCGLVALLFRQTNVFWVAVYAGASDAVRLLKSNSTTEAVPSKPKEWFDVFALSWNEKQLYDPPVEDAELQDYIKTAFSLALALLSRPVAILRRLAPYLIVLLSFGAFIFYNGSVVLGDKTNHVATLHLAQLLYLWPYIAFFSLPTLLPHLLHPSRLPLLPVVLFTPLVLLTIHLSTLIHPFTLADNRHYPFYIFRYFILSHRLIRYVWAPIYIVCAWLVVPLGLSSPPSPVQQSITPKDVKNVIRVPPSSSPSSSSQQPRDGDRDDGRSLKGGNTATTVLAWLLPTVLSLATAPLVEPRYNILPWLIWRLHVPGSSSSRRIGGGERKSWWDFTPRTILLLETRWLLVINAVCGFVFLFRGFEWPQEPGRVQRFMW